MPMQYYCNLIWHRLTDSNSSSFTGMQVNQLMSCFHKCLMVNLALAAHKGGWIGLLFKRMLVFIIAGYGFFTAKPVQGVGAMAKGHAYPIVFLLCMSFSLRCYVTTFLAVAMLVISICNILLQNFKVIIFEYNYMIPSIILAGLHKGFVGGIAHLQECTMAGGESIF